MVYSYIGDAVALDVLVAQTSALPAQGDPIPANE